MEVKCPRTKRFHFSINFEEYIEDLEKIGIEQQTPIIINVPCNKCKMIETYELYKNRIVIKSKNNKNSSQ